jgi:hypothetical protein
MPARRPDRDSVVFLNVPYSPSYERLLVGLTAALVSIGRVPKLAFEVAEGGHGRLRRIFRLLKGSRVSIHDLSAVGTPVRFNMPFELGMACALQLERGDHDFLILDSKPFRLQATLSDVLGIDAKIHQASVQGAICAVLESLESTEGNPPAIEVLKLYRKAMKLVPLLKRQHGNSNIFSKRVYGELVAAMWVLAVRTGVQSK